MAITEGIFTPCFFALIKKNTGLERTKVKRVIIRKLNKLVEIHEILPVERKTNK